MALHSVTCLTTNTNCEALRLFSCGNELILNITWHEPLFFNLQIAALKPDESILSPTYLVKDKESDSRGNTSFSVSPVERAACSFAVERAACAFRRNHPHKQAGSMFYFARK